MVVFYLKKLWHYKWLEYSSIGPTKDKHTTKQSICFSSLIICTYVLNKFKSKIWKDRSMEPSLSHTHQLEHQGKISALPVKRNSDVKDFNDKSGILFYSLTLALAKSFKAMWKNKCCQHLKVEMSIFI